MLHNNAFNRVFWTQVFRTELRFSAKADDVFLSDTAILKINNYCQTMCDWSLRVPESWLARGWGGAILGPVVFDVADLYGESGQSCI